jgi:hypothetical protein
MRFDFLLFSDAAVFDWMAETSQCRYYQKAAWDEGGRDRRAESVSAVVHGQVRNEDWI